MAAPPSFDNTARLVTGSPVGAAAINAELAIQNAAGYWMTSLEFINANNAALLFVKFDPDVAPMAPQKVNQVGISQAAIDADKAAETATGWEPTGIFVTPGGALLIAYQELFPST